MKNICVYCGSRLPNDVRIAELARQLGNAIARNQWGLVYGGARVGMMGVIAEAVLSNKGNVLGIIPTALKRREVEHTGLSELIETKDMHSRKALMEKKSDAFVILPGGFGTLDEFFEILTWRQIGLHNKPIVLVNAFGYFDGLEQFTNKAISTGFIKAENRSLFCIVPTLEKCIEALEAHFGITA